MSNAGVSTENSTGVPTYIGGGDPAHSNTDYSDYYPAWLDNLADDVTVEGSLLNGAVQGPEAVRTIVSTIRALYDHQEYGFAGPYGDNGFLEEYTAQVQGKPIGCVVVVKRDAAGQTQHIAASYRPRNSLLLLSRLLGEKLAGTPYAEHFPPSDGQEDSIDEATARALIKSRIEASGVSVPGGGPADEIPRAHEIYADDAVLEWPQGGERVRGKANIIGFRSTYPARQEFEFHRTTGCHNLWVNEYTIRYDGHPVLCVGIMQFRGEKVIRERIYFCEQWEPPAWRAQWVELFDPWEPEASVSVRHPEEARSD